MKEERTNIFIIGAGVAARRLIQEIKKHRLNYNIIACVDDDKKKIGKKLLGSRILGPISKLSKLIKKYQIKEIFVAIPSTGGRLVRKILQISERLNIKLKIIPRTIDLIRGRVRIEQVREIEPQDLLGRPMIKHDLTAAQRKMRNKVILVTGAAGSIGSELSRQIILLRPKKLICFDWWENGLFYLEKKLEIYNYLKPNIKYVVGNIQDRARIEEVLAEYKPDAIFHAAAYKHVPLMESNVEEAIKNNIFGTKNLADASIKYGVKDFILISTDKAINPTNVMGATKRVTEKLMHLYSQIKNSTRFTAVRFGNVFASEGSVVPLFEEQIRKGGPLTITHPKMIRYFMTVEEAVQLIIQSWILGKNGEIFILDMGEPVKILNLAKNLIRLHGFELNKDIKIKFTGIRPGEKLFEEILLDKEGVTKTKHSKIFIVKKEEKFNSKKFLDTLTKMKSLLGKNKRKRKKFLFLLKKLVPNFKHKII